MVELSVETQLAVIAERMLVTNTRLDSIDSRIATQNGNVARLTEWKGEHNGEHRELRGLAAGLAKSNEEAEQRAGQVVMLPRWLVGAGIAGVFTLASGITAAVIKLVFS